MSYLRFIYLKSGCKRYIGRCRPVFLVLTWSKNCLILDENKQIIIIIIVVVVVVVVVAGPSSVRYLQSERTRAAAKI